MSQIATKVLTFSGVHGEQSELKCQRPCNLVGALVYLVENVP